MAGLDQPCRLRRLISKRTRNRAAHKLAVPAQIASWPVLSPCLSVPRARAIALPAAVGPAAFATSQFHIATRQRACLIAARNSFPLPSSSSWHQEYFDSAAKSLHWRNALPAYRATTQISPESNRPWYRFLPANKSAKSCIELAALLRPAALLHWS